MKKMVGVLVVLFFMYAISLPVIAQEGKKEEPKKEAPKAEEPKKEEAKDQDAPAPPERPKSLEAAVKAADTIIVGSVDWIGDKPDNWGHPPFRPTTIYVRYDDLKFLKGQFPSKKMTVIHELFQGSKSCSEQPGLNPAMFAIDKKVILLLTTIPQALETGQAVSFIPTDPDFGAMAWSEEMEKKVTELAK